DNCRNTTEIVHATRQRTGADLGVTTAGKGPDVVFIEETGDDLSVQMVSVLERLQLDGVPAKDVVLLSPEVLGSSAFSQLPENWLRRIDTVDARRLRNPSRGRLGFARVADFKGLESPFVILECSLDYPPAQERALLYVGMTRARVGLWVVRQAGRTKTDARNTGENRT
nr:ATP-binding domain-containing protein [Micromonospora sp. DSM 115978]